MAHTIVPAEVKANGDLRLPAPVRQALHLRRHGGLVGFVIEGKRVLLTKATVVPEPTLSEEELALLTRLSKRGAGRRTFRTTEAALRYLWSL
ncbi:MAG: hypothetical protein HYY59_03275 [Candidatus Omnitrophica bacterium]|nr:hypothetical protein [Candidatus Omnitrophota bacterium]MBI3021006.1 hypothetical protein [Candidatus Omnitrophota bacterium]